MLSKIIKDINNIMNIIINIFYTNKERYDYVESL